MAVLTGNEANERWSLTQYSRCSSDVYTVKSTFFFFCSRQNLLQSYNDIEDKMKGQKALMFQSLLFVFVSSSSTSSLYSATFSEILHVLLIKAFCLRVQSVSSEEMQSNAVHEVLKAKSRTCSFFLLLIV